MSVPTRFNFGPFAVGLLLVASPLATGQNQEEDYLSEDTLFEDEYAASQQQSIADPLEPVNRAIFNFNDGFYKRIMRPVANAYQAVTPDPVEKGLTNFFDNLGYPVRLTSNVLQFRLKRAGDETLAFMINTTVGLGGFLDEASKRPGFDIPKEDLGQAFGRWGIGEGFYIVLPFLGPSNLRDAVGRFGERYPDVISEPWTLLDDSTDRFAATAIEVIAESPDILDRYESYKGSAIDPYSGVRDAYTQYRRRQIEE